MRRSALVASRLFVLVCIATLPLVALAAALPRRVPVQFHVSRRSGTPVADGAFLERQLEHANLIYRPMGIELVALAPRTLHTRHARLQTRAHRDALGASVRPQVLNVFVVATLMDVDEAGRERRGVHWRVRRQPAKHFVILSAISGPYVLAHELGHFLGNPAHSDLVGNLMSYQHTDAVPTLDDAQQANVQRTLDALLVSGELRPASEPRASSLPAAPPP